MRQQCRLGLDAEAGDFLGGEHRDLGDLLGRRVDRDIGIGEEGDAALPDQHGQRRQVGVPDAGAGADDQVDVAQMPLEAAFEAADHGVGIAALQRQRGDGGGVGAHRRAGRLLRDAAPPASSISRST